MNKFSVLILASGIVFFAGCKSEAPSNGTNPESGSGKVAHTAWHCPMHPEIVRDHAGKCPICGMDLVLFESSDATSTTPKDSSPATTAPGDAKPPAGKTIHIESSVLQKIGVRTEMVDAGTLGSEVIADAEGVLDEASETSVTVRSMGYIEDATSLRAGDPVKRGQVLAKFYSPELVAAQGDWLASRRSGDSLAHLAAQERLESLGFPDASQDALERTDRVIRAFPITSPVSGWVRLRNATTGQSVMAGSELFRLVQGEGALLEARLPVSDAALIRLGDRAEVTGQGIAKSTAKVVSVVPQIDRATRSVTLRLQAAKGANIRIGGLYQARFQAKVETGFVVPQDAVLHSGRRDIVFLALGEGRFQPTEVELGPTSNGKTLVRKGIEAGDEVVVSAQFLMDGESRLQSALDQLDEGALEAPTHSGHAGR